MGAIGPESLADGDFATAGGGSNHEEVGDVRAGDEEDENNRSEQAEECGAQRAHQMLAEWGNGCAFIAVGRGVCGGKTRRDGLHVGLRGGEFNAGTQAAEDVDGVPDARSLCCGVEQREWEPDFTVGGISGAGRKDADDGEGCAIDIDGAANGVRGAVEVTLPGDVADDGDVVVGGSIVLRGDGAAG